MGLVQKYLSVALIGAAVALSAAGCSGQRGAEAGSAQAQAARTIQNTGSDTLVNLALAWAEQYAEIHPEVRVSVTGGGSGTGIAGLINKTVDLANASRAMKKEEIESAKKNGVDPVEHTVARDAIAVVVHPDNPVQGLTIPQIADIYTGKITNWQEVGGNDLPIVLLSRESNSGTYVYFLENVVRQGDEERPHVLARHAPDALVGRHQQRSAAESQRDRLRRAGVRDFRSENVGGL